MRNRKRKRKKKSEYQRFSGKKVVGKSQIRPARSGLLTFFSGLSSFLHLVCFIFLSLLCNGAAVLIYDCLYSLTNLSMVTLLSQSELVLVHLVNQGGGSRPWSWMFFDLLRFSLVVGQFDFFVHRNEEAFECSVRCWSQL